MSPLEPQRENRCPNVPFAGLEAHCRKLEDEQAILRQALADRDVCLQESEPSVAPADSELREREEADREDLGENASESVVELQRERNKLKEELMAVKDLVMVLEMELERCG